MRHKLMVWNRRSDREEEEKVYGGGPMRWIYGTALGRILSNLLAQAWVSQCVGMVKSSRWSARGIDAFIRQYEIPMQDFEEATYASFNDFFIRRFNPGARPFCSGAGELAAPAEGRYLAFARSHAEIRYPVKGKYLSAEALLGDAALAAEFHGGPLVIARLCPLDYHRFHYPAAGRRERRYRVPGPLHSVNPMVLAVKGDVLCTNERVVSVLETEGFGRLAYIEVGAMCVGKIVETNPEKVEFSRGEQKGTFLFGGSTVVLLGQPGAWEPDGDLLEKTAEGRECLVQLGERIATARQ
jgi:phosphatidylserine decarboxylase